MSRYDLEAKAEQPAVIGWDRPLQTYSAQVFTRTKAKPKEGEATIWLGTVPGELPRPRSLSSLRMPRYPKAWPASYAKTDVLGGETDGIGPRNVKRTILRPS